MSSQTVSLNLSPASSLDDPYWLNMEIKEDAIEDGMSIEEAAIIIDAAYNIKACEDQVSSDIWSNDNADNNRDIWTDVSDNTGIDAETVAAQERFVDALELGGYTEDCKYSATSIPELITYKVIVKIFRSHYDELYKLQMANGKASAATIFRDRVTHTIDVENATEVTLDNPIVSHYAVSTPVVSWQGIDGPEIHINGNTLYWEGEVTGTLRAEFDTEWDEVTITVTGEYSNSNMITGTDTSWLGTGWYSGTEDGDEIDDYQNIQCSVLAFYHYQYDELILDSPEEDESTTESDKLNICHFITKTTEGDTGDGAVDPDAKCRQHINEDVICQCGGKTQSNNYYEVVQCPAGVSDGSTLRGSVDRTTYKDCGYRDEANSPSVYEKHCCSAWPFDVPMPKCKEVVTRFTGDGKDQVDKSKYPVGTAFVVVSPTDGQCGEHTTEQVIHSRDCCEGVPPLVWDKSASTQEISNNSSGVVAVSGGAAYKPVLWKVRGSGFFLNSSCTITDLITSDHSVTVYTKDTACGGALITADDSCSATEGSIRNPDSGKWIYYAEGAPFEGTAYIDAIVTGGQYVYANDGMYRVRQKMDIIGCKYWQPPPDADILACPSHSNCSSSATGTRLIIPVLLQDDVYDQDFDRYAVLSNGDGWYTCVVYRYGDESSAERTITEKWVCL